MEAKKLREIISAQEQTDQRVNETLRKWITTVRAHLDHFMKARQRASRLTRDLEQHRKAIELTYDEFRDAAKQALDGVAAMEPLIERRAEVLKAVDAVGNEQGWKPEELRSAKRQLNGILSRDNLPSPVVVVAARDQQHQVRQWLGQTLAKTEAGWAVLQGRALDLPTVVETTDDGPRVVKAMQEEDTRQQGPRYVPVGATTPRQLSWDEMDQMAPQLWWPARTTPAQRLAWGLSFKEGTYRVGDWRLTDNVLLHVVDNKLVAVVELQTKTDVIPGTSQPLVKGWPRGAVTRLDQPAWNRVKDDARILREWVGRLTEEQRAAMEVSQARDGSYRLGAGGRLLPGETVILVVDGKPVAIIDPPRQVTYTETAAKRSVSLITGLGRVMGLKGQTAPRALTPENWDRLEVLEFLTAAELRALKVRSVKTDEGRRFLATLPDGTTREIPSGRTMILREPGGSLAIVELGLEGLKRAAKEQEADQAAWAVLRLPGQPDVRFTATTDDEFRKKVEEHFAPMNRPGHRYQMESRYRVENIHTGAEQLIDGTQVSLEEFRRQVGIQPLVVSEVDEGGRLIRDIGVFEFGRPAREQQQKELEKQQQQIDRLRMLLERQQPSQAQRQAPAAPAPPVPPTLPSDRPEPSP